MNGSQVHCAPGSCLAYIGVRQVIDVRGVGFRTADEIASKIAGASPTSPGRLQAAAVHALREAAQDGHCCLDADELLHRAVTALTTVRRVCWSSTPCLALSGWRAWMHVSQTRGRRQRRSGDVKASLESAVAAAVQEFLVGARRNDSSSWATPGGSSGDMLELPALVAMQVAGLVQRGVLKEEMSAGGGGFGRTMPLYVDWAAVSAAVSASSSHAAIGWQVLFAVPSLGRGSRRGTCEWPASGPHSAPGREGAVGARAGRSTGRVARRGAP